MNKILKITIIIAISFLVYNFIQETFFTKIGTWINGFINNKGISHLITYSIVGLPLFLGVFLINKNIFFESLGLNKSVPRGFIFSLICTLPMLIGYAFIFDFNKKITSDDILIGAVCAAFFEELYFRAILFGQIYRYTRLGFIPSILGGAVLFASAHLYQSQDFGTLVGIFVTTFLGAVLFAWAYVEWENNLWIPIFLHLFMNLFWLLFSAGENALGTFYPNIFRAITISLIIVLTIIYKKKKGEKLEVNKNTLLWKTHRVV